MNPAQCVVKTVSLALVVTAAPAFAQPEASWPAYWGCVTHARESQGGLGYVLPLNEPNPAKNIFLLPASRGGKTGVYIYTQSNIYFYALPKARADRGGFQRYSFRLDFEPSEHRRPLYVEFSRSPGGVFGTSASADTRPPAGPRPMTLRGGRAADSEARRALSHELIARVQAADRRYRVEAQSRFTGPAKAAEQIDEMLQACRVDGDTELKQAADDTRARVSKLVKGHSPSPPPQIQSGEAATAAENAP